MLELLGLIVVGAIAFRGACILMHNIVSGNVLQVPLAYMQPPGKTIVHIYMVAAIPIALVNGYLLDFSWIDCILAGVGTWLGMLIANVVLRFNEVLQFLGFGTANLGWLGFNIFRAVS